MCVCGLGRLHLQSPRYMDCFLCACVCIMRVCVCMCVRTYAQVCVQVCVQVCWIYLPVQSLGAWLNNYDCECLQLIHSHIL